MRRRIQLLLWSLDDLLHPTSMSKGTAESDALIRPLQTLLATEHARPLSAFCSTRQVLCLIELGEQCGPPRAGAQPQPARKLLNSASPGKGTASQAATFNALGCNTRCQSSLSGLLNSLNLALSLSGSDISYPFALHSRSQPKLWRWMGPAETAHPETSSFSKVDPYNLLC